MLLHRCLCLSGVAPPLARGLGSVLACPLCGFYSLKVFHSSLKDQHKNGYAPISSPRAKNLQSPLYSKPFRTVCLFVCQSPQTSAVQIHSNLSIGSLRYPHHCPFSALQLKTFVVSCMYLLPLLGMAEGSLTVLSGPTTLRTIAWLCAHLFCSSWGIADSQVNAFLSFPGYSGDEQSPNQPDP